MKGSRLQLKFQASINTQAVVRALEDIRESKVFEFADVILTVAEFCQDCLRMLTELGSRRPGSGRCLGKLDRGFDKADIPVLGVMVNSKNWFALFGSVTGFSTTG